MSSRQDLALIGPGAYPSRPVATTDDAPNAIKDWLDGMTWPHLPILAHCVAQQIDSGHEMADVYYDDTVELDEPFVGVRIVPTFRDDEFITVDRATFDALVADICQTAIDHSPVVLPDGWPAFLIGAEVILRRAGAG